MRDGKKIETLETKDATTAGLIKLMVGRETKTGFIDRPKITDREVVFEARDVVGNGTGPLSFVVHKGEIFGLGGLVGAGRTEIVRALFGAERLDAGKVFIDGKEAVIKNPAHAVKLGIGFVPEDRKTLGAILDFPVQWNITLVSLKEISNGLLLNKQKEGETAEKERAALDIKMANLFQEAKNLSGGNQQKVVLAKWLASQCRILILDEPTRGVDVGAKQEIYAIMNNLAASGIAIIMISSEMDELLGMCDRITVLYEGKQMGFLERSEFSPEKMLTLASGQPLQAVQAA
jgi:ribose transport system ATP-binding protein